MATATARQQHRLLLLFALLAAVFAMHSLDGTHAAATPVTAPASHTMTMAMPMPDLPEHPTDNACHDMAQIAGGCLALLVAAVAAGGLLPRRGSVPLRTNPLGQPTARPGPAPRPNAPPDLTVLSVCRT